MCRHVTSAHERRSASYVQQAAHPSIHVSLSPLPRDSSVAILGNHTSYAPCEPAPGGGAGYIPQTDRAQGGRVTNAHGRRDCRLRSAWHLRSVRQSVKRRRSKCQVWQLHPMYGKSLKCFPTQVRGRAVCVRTCSPLHPTGARGRLPMCMPMWDRSSADARHGRSLRRPSPRVAAGSVRS